MPTDQDEAQKHLGGPKSWQKLLGIKDANIDVREQKHFLGRFIHPTIVAGMYDEDGKFISMPQGPFTDASRYIGYVSTGAAVDDTGGTSGSLHNLTDDEIYEVIFMRQQNATRNISFPQLYVKTQSGDTAAVVNSIHGIDTSDKAATWVLSANNIVSDSFVAAGVLVPGVAPFLLFPGGQAYMDMADYQALDNATSGWRYRRYRFG